MDTLAESLGNGVAAEERERVEEVVRSCAQQQISPIREILAATKVDEGRFLRGLAQRFSLTWWEEELPPINESLRLIFPARLAWQFHIYPVSLEEGGLAVVTYDPLNLLARQVVAQSVRGPVIWQMASRRTVLAALRSGYGVGAETFDAILAGRTDDDLATDTVQEVNRLDQDDAEASVIGFVNQILREALEERATDIHIEPLESDLRIRYRIDGMLHEVPVPPRIKLLQFNLISRLKIMAHLDIAERRLPQDGRINLEMEGQPVDVRVATIPTLSGESISLRLLARTRFDFSVLGLSAPMEKTVRGLISQPNGILLLTGPTGCGKSTTLYAFLSMLNTMDRRIVTVEDPVEHKLSGVMQIGIKPEIDLTFATALRSILRGDPNVIMVGEMRDFETAEIAIRAALTGHLVFSTLHTNDAVGGITRLVDMGVQPFLVSSSVRAFLAQRLVRRLCPTCKAPAEHPEQFVRSVGFPAELAGQILQPRGCEECRQTGYRGRLALFEVCVLSPALQEMINQRKPEELLRARALQDGMIPLRQDGWLRVAAGLTSVEEVIRATSADADLIEE